MAARRPTRIVPAAPGGALKRRYEALCALALKLPGVEISSSYRTPSIKVKGKFLGRLRTEAEGAFAIRCDFLDRQILMQAHPAAFFVTDHYLNYPMVLVRLDQVGRRELSDLLERAWRMVATPALIRQKEEGSASSPRQ
ncbi:MAG TPA: MmcQ/YjbR family DNA-binding protein [Steroidobacteraceae bacterium]|jgi:hypothetical protein|nr:MmcQ/YjbR family DNA-binding protein [Steroidobacteraceae bacterium]